MSLLSLLLVILFPRDLSISQDSVVIYQKFGYEYTIPVSVDIRVSQSRISATIGKESYSGKITEGKKYNDAIYYKTDTNLNVTVGHETIIIYVDGETIEFKYVQRPKKRIPKQE